MNKKTFLIVLFTLATSVTGSAQHIFSIGPMFHLNIGAKQYKPSIGLEFAYWNLESFPYSVDLGFDIEKSKFRIYSELQTGVAVAGISAGPVVEFKPDSPVQLGLQGSIWGNYYLGFDLRFRFMKGQNYTAPGAYCKFLFTRELWENNDENNSSSDFDWD